MEEEKELSQVGQGFNDSRGEIPDKKDIPKNNGQNLDNDPAHRRGNEKPLSPPDGTHKGEKKQAGYEDATN